MVYPALLPLMRTLQLPVVDWTDGPANLNGLVCFAERRNLISACVPSHFKRSLHSEWSLYELRKTYEGLQGRKWKWMQCFVLQLQVLCLICLCKNLLVFLTVNPQVYTCTLLAGYSWNFVLEVHKKLPAHFRFDEGFTSQLSTFMMEQLKARSTADTEE
jgi:hypothetical protein